jgi:hypothetical protein
MFKKVFQGVVVGAAMLGLAGAAGATDYELNLYGASAQFKFWNAAVPTFMGTPVADGGLGCTTPIQTNSKDASHGISYGTNCDADGAGGNNDTVTIRYSSKNSSYGIGVACGIPKYSTDVGCPAGKTKMCTSVGNPAQPCAKDCYEVHVGASDVEMTSFTQLVDQANTFMYNYGTQWTDEFGVDQITCPSPGNQSSEYLNPPYNCDEVLDGKEKSVVVPFGFFANNDIYKYRCTEPAPKGANGEHYAYAHWGWQCIPGKQLCIEGKCSISDADCDTDADCAIVEDSDYSHDCIGYWKCFDSGNGDCSDEAYTTEEDCEANGTCSAGGYSTEEECLQAAGICSDGGFTVYEDCIAAAGTCDPDTYTTYEDCIGNNGTWNPTYTWTPEYSWAYNTWTGWGKTCGGKDPANYDPGVSSLGKSCSANGNLDCPNLIDETKCEAMPIDNLSRLMVLQIFSSDNEDWLDNWNQFGPWYPDAGIVRCMRCAGSGTHATFDMQVFRNDATVMGKSLDDRFYHHESSSRLTDCVNNNGWDPSWGPEWDGYDKPRYAVGYADVDKILKSSSYPRVHIVKYQGVEPARAKIENNEYNFWAAQTLYWSTDEIEDPLGDGSISLTYLLGKLTDAAKKSSFLATISPQKLFWTTQGEMACQKTPLERSYPTVVPESSPIHPDKY